MESSTKYRRRLAQPAAALLALFLLLPTGESAAWPLSLLSYNINGAGAPGSGGRAALQRIIDYLAPDVVLLQEGKGLANLEDFLADNPAYESVYSSADGAGNRRAVMSLYPLVAGSAIEHGLSGNGQTSKRTLLEATIDLPGQDLLVWVAHWDASVNAIRQQESVASAAIVAASMAADPLALLVYAGDLNEEDGDAEVASLLNEGLLLLSPLDVNNSRPETLNADPARGTYLSRRVDYLLPSPALAAFVVGGEVLNTLTFAAGSLPPGLLANDTVDSSDHLPVLLALEITAGGDGCGDVNSDGTINVIDAMLVAQFTVGLRACTTLSSFVKCDVSPPGTPDGTCSIADALRMAQCSVGLVSCDMVCGALACN